MFGSPFELFDLAWAVFDFRYVFIFGVRIVRSWLRC